MIALERAVIRMNTLTLAVNIARAGLGIPPEPLYDDANAWLRSVNAARDAAETEDPSRRFPGSGT